MSHKEIPEWFDCIKHKHPRLFGVVEDLGKVVREEGPLDKKTTHLIQLAAAAAIRSEGSVHSHVRRAIEAGATPDEISHAIIVLTSTIGFPQVSAALRWVGDVIQEEA